MFVRICSASLVACAAVAVVACSSPPSFQGAESNVKESPRPKTRDAGAAPVLPTGDAGPRTGTALPAAPSCTATKTLEECTTCCVGPNGKATVKTLSDKFDDCYCGGSKAKCSPECAALRCSNEPVSVSSDADPCATCAVDAERCDQDATKACAADPTCAAAVACIKASDCNSKDAPGDVDEAEKPGSGSSDEK